MMLLLNIFLWLLIIVFALVILVLILPINIEFRYDDGEIDFKIKVLFMRIDKLVKWFSEKKDKAPKKEPKKEKRDKKLKDIQNAAKYVKALVSTSGKIIKMVLKALKLKKLNLRIVVGSEEASKTATNYGALCAAVYPAASAFIACNEPKSYDISVTPNFVAEKIKIFADLQLRTRIINFLIIIIKLFKIIRNKLK